MNILILGVIFLCELGAAVCFFFFFFQAEDGIRDATVTGVQTCALPICSFPHIGPGQAEVFAVGSWTSQIARLEDEGGGTLRVGDLDVERDLTDVRDVCRAYRLLLDPAVPLETYNVASGTAVRLAEVVDLLLGLARCPIEVERDPARTRPVDIPVQRGDPSRLAEATGWRPAIPLEQTLRDALDYARAALPRERTSAG